MTQAIVVLSGGQDSVTCLHWALREFGSGHVLALSFDYGSRHRVELVSASKVAKLAGVPHTVLPINTLKVLGGSALVGDGDINCQDGTNAHLPASFVPGRNLLFLTIAAAWAYQRGIHDLVCGVSGADNAGYPDTRAKTIASLEATLRLGMEWPIKIHTPLMDLDKAATVKLAMKLGPQVMASLSWSHTCYEGTYPPCGHCPACILRAKGFQEAGIEDPLIVRARKEGLL